MLWLMMKVFFCIENKNWKVRNSFKFSWNVYLDSSFCFLLYLFIFIDELHLGTSRLICYSWSWSIIIKFSELLAAPFKTIRNLLKYAEQKECFRYPLSRAKRFDAGFFVTFFVCGLKLRITIRTIYSFTVYN